MDFRCRVCCEPILNICEIGLIGEFRTKKRVRVSQKAPPMQKKKKSWQSQKHQAVTMSLLRAIQQVGLHSLWAMKKRCACPFGMSLVLCVCKSIQWPTS